MTVDSALRLLLSETENTEGTEVFNDSVKIEDTESYWQPIVKRSPQYSHHHNK